MNDQLLTVKEVMARLKIGRTTLYALISRNEIASVTIGRGRRIPQSSLDNYIARLLAEAENN